MAGTVLFELLLVHFTLISAHRSVRAVLMGGSALSPGAVGSQEASAEAANAMRR
jgi:hypothetical protein